MSTTTDRLKKLRNLANHPATPPAEAAAARVKIAAIEERNPQAKERSYSDDDLKAARARQERVIRENLDRMAREAEERKAREAAARNKPRQEPHRFDYATPQAYDAAWREWVKHNPVTAASRFREQPRRGHYATAEAWMAAMEEWDREKRSTAFHPDPFAAWEDLPNTGRPHPHYGHDDEAKRKRAAEKARIAATRTYPHIAQQLHDFGIDMPPYAWESFLYELLKSQ